VGQELITIPVKVVKHLAASNEIK